MTKRKLILIGERPLYFFQSYYGTVGWLKNKFPTDLVWYSKNHNVKFFYEERNTRSQAALWKYALRHPEFFRQIKTDFEKRSKQLINFFQALDVSKAANKQLFAAYQLVTLFYQDYQGNGNAYCRLVDRYGLQALRSSLQRLGVEDTEYAITILTATEQESYVAREERFFWTGILKANTKLKQEKFLRSHLRRYAWVRRSYMEEPALSLGDLKKRLVRSPKDLRKEKLAHLAEVLKNNKQLKREVIKKYDLRKDIIAAAKILSKSAYLKDYLRGRIAEVYYYSDKLFDELEKSTSLTRVQIKNSTIDEFAKIFLEKKNPDLSLLKKRESGEYVVYLERGKIIVQYGKDAKKFERDYLVDNSLVGLKEFHGRPASLGEATGSVRVIYKWNEMETFKEGEILVVNNTNPAFVPYLHKAAAIIAAEGGVTVHAAIISREMKIPCVIGIRDVTRLLKTGERVYVNANKGVVQKI